MLINHDLGDDEARLFKPKLTAVTIGTELAQIANVVAGKMGALIAAIVSWTGGCSKLFMRMAMHSGGKDRRNHDDQRKPPAEFTQECAGLVR